MKFWFNKITFIIIVNISHVIIMYNELHESTFIVELLSTSSSTFICTYESPTISVNSHACIQYSIIILCKRATYILYYTAICYLLRHDYLIHDTYR